MSTFGFFYKMKFTDIVDAIKLPGFNH